VKIAEVKIFPFEPGDLQKKLKAYAEITVDDALTLKGIKIFKKGMVASSSPFPQFRAKTKLSTILLSRKP